MSKAKQLLSEISTVKSGDFQVSTLQRTEKGKTFPEYVIKIGGGSIRIMKDQVSQLKKIIDQLER